VGARILIVTNGHLARNPRVVKEAETLGRAGYDVTVLQVRNHPPSEPLDAGLIAGAPYRREAVDLLPGWSRGMMPFARRLLQSGARRACVRWRLQTPEALGPARSLLSRARRIPADLTIVHNAVAHWVGIELMREGRRVAADIEDWHSEDLLPVDRERGPLDLMRRIERTLLRACVYTTTTSEALAAGLFARYQGRRPKVVTNSFPLQPLDPFHPPGHPPAFFWFSQTIGPGRGLEAFLSAWPKGRHPSRLVLLGAIDEAYRRRLLEMVPATFRPMISILPPVPPRDLPDVIARHDIGLALEESEILSRDLTITNKILQYLNAGLAVLASDTAGQREVLASGAAAGRLIRLNEPVQLISAMDSLLADAKSLDTARRSARELARRRYSWEQDGQCLLKIVEEALQHTEDWSEAVATAGKAEPN
jgi:glycosyltransferase involved in cell wall biosynthesis